MADEPITSTDRTTTPITPPSTTRTRTTTTSTRKRIGITNAQRAALRRHAHTHPRLRQAQLASWYESTYGHKVSQGTISESLSPRFADLDAAITNPALLERQKARSEAWPELESALFAWYSGIKDDGPVPNALLRTKAEELWPTLRSCREQQPLPTFSNGWLDRFKKRHNMHRRRVSAATRYFAPPSGNGVCDRVADGGAEHTQFNPRDADVFGAGDVSLGAAYRDHATPGSTRSEQQSRLESTLLSNVTPDFSTLMAEETAVSFQVRSADEHSEEIAKITTTEALQCLHTLELYELQQEDGQHEFVEALYKHRSLILKRHYAARKQQAATPGPFG